MGVAGLSASTIGVIPRGTWSEVGSAAGIGALFGHSRPSLLIGLDVAE